MSRFMWVTGEQLDAIKRAIRDADLRTPATHGSNDEGVRARNKRERDYEVAQQKRRLQEILDTAGREAAK